MQIVPFEPNHLLRFKLQQEQQVQLGIDFDYDYARQIAVPGLSFTGLADHKVIGCAGILPLWEGVGEAWALLGCDMAEHGVSVTRHVYRFLLRFQEHERQFHRIQTAVAYGYLRGEAWAVRLGFMAEGLMISYGSDGSDYIRYARIVR